MALYTKGELLAMTVNNHQFKLNLFYKEPVFAAGFLENIDVIQALNEAEKIEMAGTMVLTCSYFQEAVDKLEKLISDNSQPDQPMSSSSQSNPDNFYWFLSRALLVMKLILPLKDINNRDAHLFLTEQLSSETEDSATLFASFRPFEKMVTEFFKINSAVIAMNLALHVSLDCRPALHRLFLKSLPKRSFVAIDDCFRLDDMLTLFTGPYPFMALENYKVPPLDYSESLSHNEIRAFELYIKFPQLVHARLINDVDKIALRLDAGMMPKHWYRLIDLEKDARFAMKEATALLIIINRLLELRTYRSHYERFGLFGVVNRLLYPPEERHTHTPRL